MRLDDVVRRAIPPEPWSEGENIPWNEPGFSRRMLREHLSQAHDAASRRMETIDAHVDWIHSALLAEKRSHLLDVCCGPGLYMTRLARLGHTVRGIDFSPASIAYAQETAEREGLSLELTESDVRKADFGAGLDLAMMISGELNVFRREDARDILARAKAALAPGGRLLLEVMPYEGVQRRGAVRSRWYTAESGLWSDNPHLVFEEAFWDEESSITTVRWFVIDSDDGEFSLYAASYQAYDDAGLRELLVEAGLVEVEQFEAMGEGTFDREFTVYVARAG
jgi:SAM-dependent methyltransferase